MSSEPINNDVLVSILMDDYDILVTQCTFSGHNFHDNYVIQTNEGKAYFIRVYRNGIRNQNEILFELEFINFLKKRGLNVSFPIPRNDGLYITEITCPSGIAEFVVFSFALGNFPDPTKEVSYLYGQFIATFQKAATGFEAKHQRTFDLDLYHIIDRPLEIIRSFLSYRSDDLKYLEHLALVIRDKITKLPVHHLHKGTCHGDLHLMNVYIDNNKFTIFDFDCCANGFLAYDLGSVRWDFAFEDELWKAFLKGYTEVRELNKIELQAIPLLATVRSLWMIGHNLTYREIYNVGECDDDFWDNNIKFIKMWVLKNNYF
ncbi:phosphotransferase enzyme family protein [Paenibacillus favisporus]|uniref:phosphotransferase enzyme family protein n=1 Tax=Paenibacillus favisporus TaxID=221028 RepID=UPI0013D879AB|nr:phosphotransferase [Paenibacillus favisporus]